MVFQFLFLPESRSGELLPANLWSFWSQRLRWAMGWDQVTVRYAKGFWKAPIPFTRRLGLYYIFVARWVTQLCAVIIIVFNFFPALQALKVEDAKTFTLDQPPQISQMQVISFHLYVVFLAFVLLRAASMECHPRLLLGLLVYFTVAPAYVVFGTSLLCTSLLRIASGRTGKWIVTARATGTQEPLLGGVLPEEHQPCILFIGFAIQGAAFGSLVGALLGRYQKVEPLWGWVPFGIGATYETVIDGRYVAGGLIIGLCSSILLVNSVLPTVPIETSTATVGHVGAVQ